MLSELKRKGLIWGLTILMVLALVSACSQKADESQKVQIDEQKSDQKVASASKLSPEMEELLEKLRDDLSNGESDKSGDVLLFENDTNDTKVSKLTQEELMMQQALNQTLLELLSLDPKKEGKKVEELLGDIKVFGDEAVSVINVMLEEDRPQNEKIVLTYALGMLDSTEASDKLYEIAKSEASPEVREAAVKTLSASSSKKEYAQKTVEMLYEEARDMSDKSVDDQITIVTLLGVNGSDDSFSTLELILEGSEEDSVRIAALNAIAKIGGDSAEEILFDILRGDETLRTTAAKNLGDLGNEDVVAKLGEMIVSEDETSESKQVAVEALGYNKQRGARRILLGILSNKKASVDFHRSAAKSLSQNITDEEVVPLIELMVNSDLDHIHNVISPLIAKRGSVAAKEIEPNLEYTKEVSKLNLIRTLGMINGKDSKDKSFDVLNDYYLIHPEETVGVKAELLQAMGNLKTPRSVSVFEKVVWESDNVPLRTLAIRNIGNVLGNDSAAFAARVLSMESERDLQYSAVDLLRKYGSSNEKSVLISVKMSNDDLEFEKNIDSAILAIEARENSARN